ncbi:MAG: site-specific integrase, partial [Beijerinckiaceae bacterium]|nr:site-specific integrase [Beijerinckiaceae bacterium]
RGDLDTSIAPEDRVTEAAVAAYIDALLDMGNCGHAVWNRLQELKAALRLLAPGVDFGWLLYPGGVDVRQWLDMTRRSFTVHHPRKLYRWGFDLMRKALTLTGPRRRQVMLRDGLMIALLAARAMRQRSVEAMDLDTQVRRIEGQWHVLLGTQDMKTGKALSYPVPPSLNPWIERYVGVERVELLAGKACDAFWVNWDGEPLRAAGIEKRVRWWSAKKFGPKGAFGPHRFRYGIATVAPVADPDAPANGAIVLGITRGTFAEAYDRGNREVAAQAYLDSLEAERERTRGFAERTFEARFGPVKVPKPSPQGGSPE